MLPVQFFPNNWTLFSNFQLSAQRGMMGYRQYCPCIFIIEIESSFWIIFDLELKSWNPLCLYFLQLHHVILDHGGLSLRDNHG